jgi:acyl-CoA-binding protein
VKLLGYALGMQGLKGDCNTQRPKSPLDIKGKYKWDAWNSLRGID